MITNMNFNKYKRFFAFGCSFTGYRYPTWADILAKEMPDAEFYNFGKSGIGNLAISAKLVEANTRYRFNENDLVVVLYSTHFREDRYINGEWAGPGNIYNQSLYPMKSFVIPYCPPEGMLIRDLSVISMSITYAKSLLSDTILLRSVPINDKNCGIEESNEDILYKICEVYKDTFNDMPPSLYDIVFPDGPFAGSVTTLDDGTLFADDHPTPILYYKFLQKLGFPLTDRSEEYAISSETKVKQCKIWENFYDIFPDILRNTQQAQRMLF